MTARIVERKSPHTNTSIARLKHPITGFKEYSDPGSRLRIRMYASGNVSLVTSLPAYSKDYKRVNPKTKVITAWNDNIDLDAVRVKADEMHKVAKSNVGINNFKATQRTTFDTLFKELFQRRTSPTITKGRWAPGTAEGYRSAYVNWIKWKIGHMDVRDIDPLVVASILNDCNEAGLMTHQNRVYSLMRQTMRLGVTKGLIRHNPVSADNISPDQIGAVINRRTRSLDMSNLGETDPKRPELIDFWSRIEKTPGEPLRPLLLKLLLVTGMRVSELASGRWAELTTVGAPGNWSRVRWIIPAPRIKPFVRRINAGMTDVSDFAIDLPPIAISLLNRLYALTGGDECMFPQARAGGSIIHSSISQRLRWLFTDENKYGTATKRFFDFEPFTPHDLRRTFRNCFSMEGCEFDSAIVEACMTHFPKDSAQAHYDHDKLTRKRAEALVTLNNYLISLGLDAGATS